MKLLRVAPAVLVLTGALAIAPANGGEGNGIPSESLGSAGDLNYRSVSYGPWSGGIDLFSDCAGGGVIAGGGVNVNSSAAHVAYGMPGDDFNDAEEKPDDWWEGAAQSLGPDDLTITTYSICKKTQTRKVKYKTDQVQVAKDGVLSEKVMCPAGSGVISGGGHVYRGAQSISAPADGNDADHIPDDGWQVKALNTEGNSVDIDLYAVCTSTGVAQYKSHTIKLKHNQAKATAVTCGETFSVIGGGFKVTGSPAKHWASSTKPKDDRSDGNHVPDDRWSIKATNVSNTRSAKATAYAICFR